MVKESIPCEKEKERIACETAEEMEYMDDRHRLPWAEDELLHDYVMDTTRPCAVCGRKSRFRCQKQVGGKTLITYYCSKGHQEMDRRRYKRQCKLAKGKN